MSAVDRMVVRVRGAGYRSLPRRQALALISAGRAEADRRTRLDEPIRQPDPVVITGTPETIATKMDELTGMSPVVDVDQARAQLAEAMDVPLEVITPTPGSNPHDVVAAQSQEMLDHLASETVNVEITTAPETAKLLGIVGGSTELPPEPKPSARRGEWADYADSLGVEVTSAMTKREIQTAAQEAAQSLSNLPQPALPGGRLDTPEDEPVTDGSVTDDEDSRTE